MCVQLLSTTWSVTPLWRFPITVCPYDTKKSSKKYRCHRDREILTVRGWIGFCLRHCAGKTQLKRKPLLLHRLAVFCMEQDQGVKLTAQACRLLWWSVLSMWQPACSISGALIFISPSVSKFSHLRTTYACHTEGPNCTDNFNSLILLLILSTISCSLMAPCQVIYISACCRN